MELRSTPSARSRYHRRPVVLAVAFGSVVSLSASAATWHVDGGSPSCSDAGPGNVAVPFCTIVQGAASAQPGDTVLVHPATYREQVTPFLSGAPGQPITYRAAAPGAVILGTADLSDPAGWSATATNAWSRAFAPASSPPSQVFKDGVRLAQAQSAAGTAPDSFFYDPIAKLLYVDVGGQNPGLGHAIEAGARAFGFDLDGRAEIIVDGFDVLA